MELKDILIKYNIDIEDTDVRNRLIIILMGTLFAIFAGLVNYAVGLDPILNIAVVLCIFIVLAGVIAYTWEEKKELIAEQTAGSDEAVAEASLHVQSIEKILITLQSRLNESKDKIKQVSIKIPESVTEKVDVIEKLEERLTSRIHEMNEIIDSKEIEKFDEIPSIAKGDIVFKNDAANVLITEKKLPNLAFDQLEDTVDKLIERIDAELASL